MKVVRQIIVLGYFVIIAIIVGIICIYMQEWKQLEILTSEDKHIHCIRNNVHDAYAQMLDLTMYGETILEWESTDTIRYRSKRLQLDSLLCEFKQDYPPYRLDSLCRLLEDKEKQLLNIWTLLQVQDTLNAQLASRVPIIAYKSTQNPSEKSGGFLGLFKNKKKSETTTSTMLYTLNKDVIERQRKQARELDAFADSLVTRNNVLNHKLEEIISQMDATIQQDLLERERIITSTRERGFYAIAISTALMLFVIVVQILVIKQDSHKIQKKEKETEDLIRKQKTMLAENEELLNARQKMMHTITHELRISLSSIIGYAGLLEEETDEKVQQEYMGNIKQAAGRMTSQLNSLLTSTHFDGRFCNRLKISV